MPANEERYYSEKVIRLPDTFSSADRHPIADLPQARADYGLPDVGTVFCAFNNPLKIEAEVFSAWMRILAALPGSVLWLSRANEAAAERLRAKARDAGVAPDRLIFATRVPDKRVHLARHALAAGDTDAYVDQAINLGLDPDARAALKTKLADLRETAPLFDAHCFTRHLDAAYRHIWRRHAAGLTPKSFTQPVLRTG
jgi:predicted O-linked N-acetylglucosamine transferase (SPINDLY family)